MTGPLRWDLATIAEAVSGTVVGDPAIVVSSVSTDSRSIEPGGLFVAVAGERFDGHDYLGEAAAAGAVAAMVAKDRVDDARPHVEVADTVEALRDLAVFRRSLLHSTVVAVTGSTGKTTTKDLLAAALPRAWASPRSYNNEIGVPLTVLSAPDDSPYLVLEVGSRGVGHIHWLAPAVRPHVAVITNLGLVHLETFETTDRLAQAKWELIESLEGPAVAVVPFAEPRLRQPHAGRTVTFGDAAEADVRVDHVSLDDHGRPTFNLVAGDELRRVSLPLAGRHQATNAAAAAAAALAAGASLDTVIDGIEQARSSPWRMEVHPGSFTVVNDAYNANPDSMESALRTVAEMPGRCIAILGLMAELGPVAEEEHRRIGELTAALGFEAVIVVGEDPGIARGAGSRAHRVAHTEEAIAAAVALIEPGDVVLVKASRVVGLEGVAEQLIEEAVAA